MASLTRDIYDLCYERQRGPQPVLRDPKGVAIQKRNEHKTHLNNLSKKLRHELEKKDAFIFCLDFYMRHLDPTLEKAKKTRSSCTSASRPDMENEEEVILARLNAARADPTVEMLAASLKSTGKLVARSEGYIPWHNEPRLFYRVCHDGSFTFFDDDIGFCCARWLRERNFGEPGRRDVIDHVEGNHFASPYISLTESPCCALRIRKWKDVNTSVFVIDTARLQAANILVERTTDLAHQHAIPYKGHNRIHFITATHWLAQFWIPVDCIVKRVSFNHFKQVCTKNGISEGKFLDISFRW